ncbi:MAG: MiaB/RimO family radical SAM methylthiotransferase, partial [bacterium]
TIGIHDLKKIGDICNKLFNIDRKVAAKNCPEQPSLLRHLSGPGHYAYLKISDGCSHLCSFCSIPLIRGPYRSRPVAELVREAQALEESGIKELILVAQDTTYYGKDIYNRLRLPGLLKHLIKETSIPWIRIMYSYPSLINDELLRTMADNSRICPYLDMPLQHVSKSILKAMKRPRSIKFYEEKIQKIRSFMPDIKLRTTFIIGFPGETPGNHNELTEFIVSNKFDKIGVFAFSPEEHTPAFKFKPRIPKLTINKRINDLMKLQQIISRGKLKSFIGKTVTVIIDGASNKKSYKMTGRTVYDAPEIDGMVYIKNQVPSGVFRKIKIYKTGVYDLYGKYLQ